MSADHGDSLVDDLQRLGARMLAETTPITADEIVGCSRWRVSGEPLLDGRVVGARSDGGHEVGVGDVPSRGRRASVLVGAVAAASLLSGGLVIANRLGTEPDTRAVGEPVASPAPAVVTGPATTDVASTVQLNRSLDDLGWPPRLLVDDSWDIVTANDSSMNEGYMTLRRDDTTVYVGWYRGEVGPDKGDVEVGTATLLGETVTVYEPSPAYSSDDIRDLVERGEIESEIVRDEFGPVDTADVETSVPGGDLVGGPILDAELADELNDGLIESVPSSGPFVGLQWDGSIITVSVMPTAGAQSYDTAAFTAMLASIGHVDQQTWEAALPDRVVRPAQRQQVVDEMLADIPQPGGTDFGVVGDDPLVRDRVDLAAELQQRVACAWLNRYFEADPESPDATEALDAIATIPDWRISREIVDAWENADEALVTPANTGLGSLTVNDGTITYEGTGEIVDGYSAAQLCDGDAVG
jgi:hypothetical protein